MNSLMISMRTVSAGYEKKTVYRALSFDVVSGDHVGIIGPNGSGKTTLIRSLMGVQPIQAGEIQRAKDVRFGFCSQRQHLEMTVPFRVYEIIIMARTRLIGWVRSPSVADREAVERAMEMTGIADYSERYFHTLSGGLKQRVLLARALATEPSVLVLDEPTADLDLRARRELLKLIQGLRIEHSLTLIHVTHDLNDILESANRFVFMNPDWESPLIFNGRPTAQALSSLYGIDVQVFEKDGRVRVG